MSNANATLPENLIAIENFSAYAMSNDGRVFRIRPATRGKSAGKTYAIRPVIHPRGFRWYVQIQDDNGKRHRIALVELQKSVLGVETNS